MTEKRRMGKIPASVIRLPPSHPYYLRSRNKDRGENEGNTEVLGSCSYYLKRCRRTRIESLHDDLLFEILVRLRAQDIYEHARFVCWKWYRIIHTRKFLSEHFKHLTYGLLFCVSKGNLLLMSEQRGRIEISRGTLNDYPQALTHILLTCNGLCVQTEGYDYPILCVRNPITKQKLTLPRPPSSIYLTAYGIAYSAVSMVYKVVFIHRELVQPYKCFILTVGVDEYWRNVEIDHLSPAAMEGLHRAPLITEGFMHWHMHGPKILTLDIETEIFTEIPFRIPSSGNYVYYFSTGRYVSMVTGCLGALWDVLEMRPETGECRKVCDFYLEGSFGTEKFILPLGWLKYLEVLVFFAGHTLFFYNILTHKTQWLDALLPTPFPLKRFPICNMMVHKNSLCWLHHC